MAAYEVLLLNTAIPQIQAAQSGDTYVCPRDIQITANLDVTGNTILGNASTDTVLVNGKIGVNTTDTSAGVLQIRQLADTNTGGIRLENTTNVGAFVVYKQLSGGSIIRDSGSDALLINGSAVTAYGNVTLGNASTDTVQVNGYMGVGGAGASDRAITISGSSLTGTTQTGIFIAHTANSASTTALQGVRVSLSTAAEAFTCADLSGYRVLNATKGAGSTITNQHGVNIADLTSGTNNYGITSAISSGTNKWNIYASGTAANYFAGNVGIGTSSPNASAILDAQSTTKGVRMPNMTTTQKNAIASPAAGLIVFDTTLAKLCVYSGAAWETITSV